MDALMIARWALAHVMDRSPVEKVTSMDIYFSNSEGKIGGLVTVPPGTPYLPYSDLYEVEECPTDNINGCNCTDRRHA